MITNSIVIIGAKRVGDCAHMIPFFESIKDEFITWVTGSYEKEMALFIKSQYPNIREVILKDDGFPQDLNSCKDFVSKYRSEFDLSKFDRVHDNYMVSFDLNDSYEMKDTYFNFERFPKEDYICTHLDTVSDWKRHLCVRDLVLDGVVYGFGKVNEFILPNSIDKRGIALIEIANLLCKCKLYIGIHSAISCLALYLNIPSIVIHPQEGLLMFNKYRSNMIDLLKPTKEDIEKAIQSL